MDNAADELHPENVRTNSRGDTVVLFSQLYEGFNVFAGYISLQINPEGEITQIYSTMATPLNGPSPSFIESVQDSANVEDAVFTLNEKSRIEEPLELDSAVPVVYPKLEGNLYTAVPAIAVKAKGADSGRMTSLGIFEAASGDLLDTRNLRNNTPYAKLYGTALPGHMGRHTWHPVCNNDSDCQNPPHTHCSDHFSPKRCVGKCTSDADCDSLDYKCFIPPDPGELEGYCYKEFWWHSQPPEILVYNGAWRYYAMEDNRAYSRVVDSLEELIDHHLDDMNIYGWDGNGSDYSVHFLTADSEDTDATDMARGAWADPNGGNIYYTGWYTSWSDTDPRQVHGQEHTMGHEWGHVLGGAACNWCSPPAAKHCLAEGLAVQFGELYVARRMDPAATWVECGGSAETGIYIDDRSGLGNASSCQPRYLHYAHRSRFDWLSCDITYPDWRQICSNDNECPPYYICEKKEDEGIRRCVDTTIEYNRGKYNQSTVMTRLLRIMDLGPSVFAADQYPQDIGIQDRPIGRVRTTRIIHDANTQVNTGTTLKDWMNLLLSAASSHGKYSETADALGASGFFPRTTTRAPYATDKTPTKIIFNGYTQSSYKEFVFWKQPNTGSIRYKYYSGSTPYYGLISTNTDSRPVAVEWGNYLHVFFRNANDNTIRVFLISTSGSVFGPYNLRAEFTPNGDFDATVYNGYLYLVFADSSNNNYATVAKCSASICYQPYSWHDFGNSNYKKAIHNIPYSAGLAAVSASRVNGVSSSFCAGPNNYLFIAVSNFSNKILRLLRVDTNDDVLTSNYIYYNHHPSYKTDSTIGLTVRDSAFDQTCMIWDPFQGWKSISTPRRYLYLAWKEYGGNRVFTSVLQNADPSDKWLTKSVETLSETKTGTGVTWVRGVGPDENQNMVKANPSNGAVEQLHGYGKY